MRKVLVVDDEIHTVRLLKKYLDSKNYDVYTATSGMEAIEKVKEVNPQVVLLDIIMPGMGGLDTLKEIKKIDPQIAVIMVTAVIDESLAKKSLQLGADDYITKPLDLNFIGTRVLVKMFQMTNHDDTNQPPSQPKKILLIDDEEDFCRALKKGLEMRGAFYTVLTAVRGEEGIFLAKTQKPDLILLDIMMPGMAGTQVAEELLADPDTSSIPIIFVTAIVKRNEIEKTDGLVGGRTFMAKPVIIDQLIEKIKSMTGAGRWVPENN